VFFIASRRKPARQLNGMMPVLCSQVLGFD
jgi:hypothetical protein